MEKHYNVRLMHGVWEIRNGNFSTGVTLEELRELAGAVNHLLESIEQGMTQDAAEYEMRVWALHKYLDSSTWVFPPTTESYVYREGQRRTGNTYRPSVYFLKHASMPDLIKIGHSQDVYDRTKALYWAFKNGECDVLAIAQTPHHKSLEQLIHWHFWGHNVDGEWFTQRPVLDWLQNIRTAVYS